MSLNRIQAAKISAVLQALASARDDLENLSECDNPTDLGAEDVEWVVNNLGELGVKIGGAFFWMYKGESVRQTLVHDLGPDEVTGWRYVGRREFGEVCRPAGWNAESAAECDWTPIPRYHGDNVAKPATHDEDESSIYGRVYGYQYYDYLRPATRADWLNSKGRTHGMFIDPIHGAVYCDGPDTDPEPPIQVHEPHDITAPARAWRQWVRTYNPTWSAEEVEKAVAHYLKNPQLKIGTDGRLESHGVDGVKVYEHGTRREN